MGWLIVVAANPVHPQVMNGCLSVTRPRGGGGGGGGGRRKRRKRQEREGGVESESKRPTLTPFYSVSIARYVSKYFHILTHSTLQSPGERPRWRPGRQQLDNQESTSGLAPKMPRHASISTVEKQAKIPGQTPSRAVPASCLLPVRPRPARLRDNTQSSLPSIYRFSSGTPPASCALLPWAAPADESHTQVYQWYLILSPLC